MRNKISPVLLVYPNGVQMSFEIPGYTVLFYIAGHKVMQPTVALFVDGQCKHAGVFTDDQIAFKEGQLS